MPRNKALTIEERSDLFASAFLAAVDATETRAAGYNDEQSRAIVAAYYKTRVALAELETAIGDELGWTVHPRAAYGALLSIAHEAWDLIRQHERRHGTFPPPDTARQLCETGIRAHAALVTAGAGH